MGLYTVHYIPANCSLYIFLVVTPFIIRSTYNLITASGTGHTVSANFRCPGAIVPAVPRQRKLPETVWPVPDAVITCSYMCSWWWVELSPETCRASSLQEYNTLNIVAYVWTIIDIHRVFYSEVLFYWHDIDTTCSLDMSSPSRDPPARVPNYQWNKPTLFIKTSV
jgi:hypothetical protein